MGAIGDRVGGWIDERAKEWQGRLGGWLLSLVAAGVGRAADEMRIKSLERTKAELAAAQRDPALGKEFKEWLEYVIRPDTPGGYLADMLFTVFNIFQVGGALGGPHANLASYWAERRLPSTRLDPDTWLRAKLRATPELSQWDGDLLDQGWTPARIETYRQTHMYYPSPIDLITWIAREVFEPAMVDKYGLDDEFGAIDLAPFAKAGMTPEQVRNHWRAHWQHASFTQLVEMMRRGKVTEQDMWDWFRLVEIPPFWRQKLIDITWEVPTRVDVRRFWDMRTISEERMREIYTSLGYHGKDLDDYILWTRVYTAFPDLLARYKNGWITLEMVQAELVTMGMSAARAQEMIEEKIKKAAPERVAAEKDLTKADIYKGVKAGRITRVQGVELLQSIGYDQDEALYLIDVNVPADEEEQAATERELTKGDLRAALKAGIISESEARQRLLALRYKANDVDLLMRTYLAVATPPVEVKARERSKADILLSVKKGLTTPEDAYLMLLDIDYAPADAQFILSVHAEESPFSPTNYAEFLELTQKWRRAVGQTAKPVTEELKAASREILRLTDEVKRLEAAVKTEAGAIHDITAVAPEVSAHLTQSRLTLQAAQVELARTRDRYNTLLAQWRHQA